MLASGIFSIILLIWLSVPVQSASQETMIVDDLYSFIDEVNHGSHFLSILSDEDVRHYASAFIHQEHAEWYAADQEITQIRQPILMGYLLSQRLLSSHYRPTADELSNWMRLYQDLPQAPAVYALARSRLMVVNPPFIPSQTNPEPTEGTDIFLEDMPIQGIQNSPLLKRFHSLLRQNKKEQAIVMLATMERQPGIASIQLDQMRVLLSFACFNDGLDEDALHWANLAIGHGHKLAEAHWIAGLATWRIGNRAASIPHFEAVASVRNQSPWLTSAGAFWASRANLVAGHPEMVNRWLQEAATHPQTFYGILARRSLGKITGYSWRNRNPGLAEKKIMERIPAISRAMALLQLHNSEAASIELQIFLPRASPLVASAMLSLAENANLPNLAIRIANMMDEKKQKISSNYFFPIPDWYPRDGWIIDKALIYAIVKQESLFNPKAKSHSGAIGLMQILPGTARTTGITGNLTDPSTNLAVGQRHIRHLLSDEPVKGNLLYLIAAYNAGQGLVTHWRQSLPPTDDPLMFIESIPYPATRSFVMNVITSFWIYQNRLDEQPTTLDAMAAGQWPYYHQD